MHNPYIALQFPTVPAPFAPMPSGRTLTQRLTEDAGFLHDYLRDGLNLIEPFRTTEHYAGFLTVQYHMLADVRRLYADEEVWRVIPDPELADAPRASRMEADLHDLEAWPPNPGATPATHGLGLMEALGWLYAGEGLMLSLDMMAQAHDLGEHLGLSEDNGGRHLLSPLGSRTRAWRSLAAVLDSARFSYAQGTDFVSGASLAYHRLDELLSLALRPRADTEPAEMI
jgi:heme oxygenase (biliverdin-IX-beta and delta-forming)